MALASRLPSINNSFNSLFFKLHKSSMHNYIVSDEPL